MRRLSPLLLLLLGCQAPQAAPSTVVSSRIRPDVSDWQYCVTGPKFPIQDSWVTYAENEWWNCDRTWRVADVLGGLEYRIISVEPRECHCQRFDADGDRDLDLFDWYLGRF